MLVAKIVQKQMERDTNILKLFNTMKSFFSIVNDLKMEFEDKPKKARRVKSTDFFECAAALGGAECSAGWHDEMHLTCEVI